LSKIIDFLRELACTVVYAGYFPVAPGTAGSAAAAAVGYLAFLLTSRVWAGIGLLVLVIPAMLGGIPLGNWAEERYSKKDPSPFVLDELAGQFLAAGALLLLFPSAKPWLVFVISFFFFRVFDVIKIFPADRLEGLSGGLGIMIDDLIAGAYAVILSAIVILLLPSLFATTSS
jgi:phosphatidylglycerophosphatase A